MQDEKPLTPDNREDPDVWSKNIHKDSVDSFGCLPDFDYTPPAPNTPLGSDSFTPLDSDLSPHVRFSSPELSPWSEPFKSRESITSRVLFTSLDQFSPPSQTTPAKTKPSKTKPAAETKLSAKTKPPT